MTTETRTSPAETQTPRRRSRPILITILGVLLIAVGAVWALVELTESTETVERSVSADEVFRLVVETHAGDITITVEDRPDIEVSTELRSNFWSESSSDVASSDGTVTVSSDCESLLLAFNCSAEHTIRIPLDRIVEMDVSTAAGTIAITGTSAEIDAETNAGGIQIREFTGPSATLRTSAGGISVEALSAPDSIIAETSAGGIDIVVPDEVYDVDVDTAAGGTDVTVRTDPGSDRSISASTRAGGITISTN